MDFVADSLFDGRRIRVLTIIDSFTRECLVLEVAKRLLSQLVTETLNRVIMHRGAARTIRVDNGTVFSLITLRPGRTIAGLRYTSSRRVDLRRARDQDLQRQAAR